MRCLLSGRWYVLSCKPNKEGILLRQLQSQGYEVFYPRHFSTNGKTGRLHIKAYFPGYLFIRLDLTQVGQSTFQWMPNAEGLVSFESRPAYVPDILIEAIKKHVEKINATRMKEYAKNNQLIYTTHLPFMIDFTRLDNIYVAEEIEKEGTKVHKNWATADKDARFTLQAALGLSWSQSLFFFFFNLIVEGVTDFWFLITLSSMFQEAGQKGIDEQLVITPAGGATKVAYVGTILHGQNLNIAVLLDSDKEGKSAYEQLVHQWILDDKHVLLLGNILGIKHLCTLEDLFSEDYYLENVNAAYSSELGDKLLEVRKEKNKPIIDRVEEALKDRGIASFNKGRVAKKIMQDLPKKKLSDMPGETVEKFGKTIVAINKIVEGWKAKQ